MLVVSCFQTIRDRRAPTAAQTVISHCESPNPNSIKRARRDRSGPPMGK